MCPAESGRRSASWIFSWLMRVVSAVTCACSADKALLMVLAASASRTDRYADAKSLAHTAAAAGAGALQLMLSTVVFGGTVTLTCLTSTCGGSALFSRRPASAATVCDCTICASLSMLTGPPVRPRVWLLLAAVALTYTDEVAM